MTCVHLTKLYQLCQKEGIRLSGSDLIHVVCDQCGEQEVCPSMLMEEYDARAESSEEKGERREEKGEG